MKADFEQIRVIFDSKFIRSGPWSAV